MTNDYMNFGHSVLRLVIADALYWFILVDHRSATVSMSIKLPRISPKLTGSLPTLEGECLIR